MRESHKAGITLVLQNIKNLLNKSRFKEDKKSKIKSILNFDKELEEVFAPMSATITLEDDLDVRNVMMNYDYTKNKTNPRITKYEMALLIGKRATQIECGATPNIKISPGQSVISIAEEELRQRKIPLIIKRPIGNTFEYWKPAHMEVSMN